MGTFCPSDVRKEYRCLAGYTSAAGSAECAACPAGKQCAVGSPAGAQCPRGSYSSEGLEICHECPVFADCNTSFSGSFDALCQSGQYYDANYGECFPCKEGLYCPGGSTEGVAPPYGFKIPNQGAPDFGPLVAQAGQIFDTTGQIVPLDSMVTGTFSPILYERGFEAGQGRIDALNGIGYFPPPGLILGEQGAGSVLPG